MKAPTEEEISAAQNVLHQDYLCDVANVADEIEERWKAGEFGSSSEAVEAIEEAVDGTQRVIYTFQAKLGMCFTDNPDAYEDSMGSAPDSVEAAMLFAMRQDVVDYLERQGIDINSDPPSEDDAKAKADLDRMAGAVEAFSTRPTVTVDDDGIVFVQTMIRDEDGEVSWIELAREGDDLWNLLTTVEGADDRDGLTFDEALNATLTALTSVYATVEV